MTSHAPAPAPGFDSAQQRRLKTGRQADDATPFGHVIIYNELITFNAHVQRPVEHGAQLNVTLTRSTTDSPTPTHTHTQSAKTAAATTTSENNNNNCQCGQLSASCLSTQLGWSWS